MKCNPLPPLLIRLLSVQGAIEGAYALGECL